MGGGDGRLGEIDAKRTHVHAVQEGAKVLGEAREALVEELQVHEVGFQVGHGVAELGELRFERREVLLGVVVVVGAEVCGGGAGVVAWGCLRGA